MQVAQARHHSLALQDSAAAASAQAAESTARAGEAGARFSALAEGLVASAGRLPEAAIGLLGLLDGGCKPLEEALTVLQEVRRVVKASPECRVDRGESVG